MVSVIERCMMKAIHWLWLFVSFGATAAVEAKLTETASDNTFISSTRLIDTNQSQSLEAIPLTEQNNSLSSYKLAGVQFIVDTTKKQQVWSSFGLDNEFTDPADDNCKRLGFAVTSCASGLFNRACPYNDRIYDKCCEASYTYEASNCPAPRKLSSETCGGKHRCYCDTAQYPFASCNDPQIKGNACTDDSGTRYATCVCPNPNNGQWGCKEYYTSPCNSVCKTPYADCCHLKTSVQTPYGCEKTYDCCSSKCEKAYSDNCRNRNAVIAKCPDNATCTYFSDCKSKVQSWSCKSGYKQSGNGCVCATSCNNTVTSKPANSYYTTSNCTACGVSKTINTGWACNSGYYKSGSSCLKSSSGGSSGGSSSGGSSSFTCPSGMGRRTCDGMQCCCPPGGDCSRSGVGSGKCLCRR